MSVSRKQLDANRRNALHSTGPTTDEGKSASARNALKHGVRANAIVAEREDKAEFIDLLDQLFLQFAPQSAVEVQLVEKLAIAFWRGGRLAIAERLAMEGEFYERQRFQGASTTLRRSKGVLEIKDSLLFGRYQVMVTNDIRRTLSMLREEQAIRLKTIDAVANADVVESCKPVGGIKSTK